MEPAGAQLHPQWCPARRHHAQHRFLERHRQGAEDAARHCRRREAVKRDPAPIAFVSTLGDSTVSIALRYWTSSADFFATQADLTKRAKQEFDSEGISIPLPPPEVPAPEVRRQ